MTAPTAPTPPHLSASEASSLTTGSAMFDASLLEHNTWRVTAPPPIATQTDEATRVALSVLIAIVTLTVLGVLGLALHWSTGRSAAAQHLRRYPDPARAIVPPAPAEAPALAPAAIVRTDTPVVRTDGSIVKFFFATGHADLPKDAPKALEQLARHAKREGQRLRITGFHHSGPDEAQQAELTQRRIQAVRAALLLLGIGEAAIDPFPPIATPPAASNEEARRVEVMLLPK